MFGVGSSTLVKPSRAAVAALAACAVAIAGCSPPANPGADADALAAPPPAPLRRDSAGDDIAGLQTLAQAVGAPAAIAWPAGLERIDERSPAWPIRAFVEAETRRDENPAAARALYARLAGWAAQRPYNDDWGGSSLGIVALWRWVQAIGKDATPDASELEQVLAIDSLLRDARLSEGVFEFSFLDTLPQIEEDLVRRLALLVHEAGMAERAQPLFLDYLRVRTQPFGPREEALFEAIIAEDWASRDRLEAISAQRLEALRRYDEAAEIWTRQLDSADAYDRAKASLRLARYEARRFELPREEISALYDRVLRDAKEPTMIQRAIYWRAILWNQTGSERDPQKFCADMQRLLARYPRGVLADDALYRLARHAQQQYLEGENSACEGGDPFDEALAQFARLREFDGDNDWFNSAYFHPAMLYYSRAAPGDLEAAEALLGKLNAVNPEGELHRHAGFWRARILEQLGRSEQARTQFEALRDAAPYDYHGLRAQMHLEMGAAAARTLWPEPALRARIARDYGSNPAYSELEGDSPYHRLLGAAVESGLYPALVKRRDALRHRLPAQRLQTIPLPFLEATPAAIVTFSLLLTLRQDAAAAADSGATAENHLQVIGVVARRARDWPLALAMASGEVHDHSGTRAIDAHPRYLSTVYFPALDDIFRAASERWQVPAELLYAVARHESLLDPAAVSVASALGLFQFIPRTFNTLDSRWELLASAGVNSRTAYLLDPERSADLGARWFRDELLANQNRKLLGRLGRDTDATALNDDSTVLVPSASWYRDGLNPDQQSVLLLAILEHNAGDSNVRDWYKAWNEQQRNQDFEYMLATANSVQARRLGRDVLTHMCLVVSIGLFANGQR